MNMTDETVDSTRQSDDSPAREYNQSSEDVQSDLVASLQRENEELKSRIGSLAQKAGTEKKQLEESWGQWAANYQAWSESELKKRDKVIERYEERFLELADDAGAKVVLEERQSREREERVAREARAEAERLRRDEIESAIEQAVAALEVSAQEIREMNPQDAKTVWAVAGRLAKTSERERIERERAPVIPPTTPEPTESSRSEEIQEQERYSRTPGEPRGDVRPAASRRQDEFQTRLNELEEALAEAKRRHRTPQAVALRGEIQALKRQQERAR